MSPPSFFCRVLAPSTLPFVRSFFLKAEDVASHFPSPCTDNVLDSLHACHPYHVLNCGTLEDTCISLKLILHVTNYYKSSHKYLTRLVHFAKISSCAAEANTHVYVGWKSSMFQNVFWLDFSQTYKLRHSSFYVLMFIHISTSP